MAYKNKEVSHTFWCETSLLFYGRLFTFAAAFIAAVTLCFPLGYEDGIAAVAHPQWGLFFCHHEAEHHLHVNVNEYLSHVLANI